MDPRRSTARTFEEVDPAVEWKQAGDNQDVVEITLPGFRKEQVRVQVDNHGVLRATGERPARGGKWVRFKKDLRLPDNCNADGVRAMFEDDKLIITLPIITDYAYSPVPSPVLTTPPSPSPQPSPPPVKDPIVKPEPSPPRPSPPPPPPPPVENSIVEKEPSPPPQPLPSPPPAVSETVIHVSPPSPPPNRDIGSPSMEEEKKKEDEKEMEGKVKTVGEVLEGGTPVVNNKKEMDLPSARDAPTATATAASTRELLVNVATAVVVLLGITLSVWHTLRS